MSDHQAGFRCTTAVQRSGGRSASAAGVDRPDAAERVAAGRRVAPAGAAARRPAAVPRSVDRRAAGPAQAGAVAGLAQVAVPRLVQADQRRRKPEGRSPQQPGRPGEPPLRGCYRIALLSLKGGVGKTTITATLGATFASIRGDRVVAVDANPDRGTLSQKVPLETPATVRHLLRDAEGIERYSDVRSYTSQGPSRLEVLASESDPAVSEAFSSDDYTRTLEVLERFYSLVLTDCGTGMMHSAMSAVLAKADVLDRHQLRIGRRRPQRVGDAGLAGRARPPGDGAQLDRGDQRGAAAVGQGRHAEGGRPLLAALPGGAAGAVRPAPGGGRGDQPGPAASRETREALIELAAVVADGFPGTQAARRPVRLGRARLLAGDCPRGRAGAGNPDRRRGRSRASSGGWPRHRVSRQPA